MDAQEETHLTVAALRERLTLYPPSTPIRILQRHPTRDSYREIDGIPELYWCELTQTLDIRISPHWKRAPDETPD
jgi:hypothetical protein